MQPTALASNLTTYLRHTCLAKTMNHKDKQLVLYFILHNTHIYRQNHTLYLLIHSQQRENIILPITISAQKLLRFLFPQPPTHHTRYFDGAR